MKGGVYAKDCSEEGGEPPWPLPDVSQLCLWEGARSLKLRGSPGPVGKPWVLGLPWPLLVPAPKFHPSCLPAQLLPLLHGPSSNASS